MLQDSFHLTLLVFRVCWIAQPRDCLESVVYGEPFVPQIGIIKLARQLLEILVVVPQFLVEIVRIGNQWELLGTHR